MEGSGPGGQEGHDGAQGDEYAGGGHDDDTSFQATLQRALDNARQTGRAVPAASVAGHQTQQQIVEPSHSHHHPQVNTELLRALSATRGDSPWSSRANLSGGGGDNSSDILRMMQLAGLASSTAPSSSIDDAVRLGNNIDSSYARVPNTLGHGSDLAQLLAQMQSQQQAQRTAAYLATGGTDETQGALNSASSLAAAGPLLQERLNQLRREHLSRLQPESNMYNRNAISDAARRAGFRGGTLPSGAAQPVLGFNNPLDRPFGSSGFDDSSNRMSNNTLQPSNVLAADGLVQQLNLERLRRLQLLQLQQQLSREQGGLQSTQSLFGPRQASPATAAASPSGVGFSPRVHTATTDTDAAAAVTAGHRSDSGDNDDDDERATPPEERKRPASVSGITPSAVAAAANAAQRIAQSSMGQGDKDRKKRPMSSLEASLQEKQLKRLKAQALQNAAQSFSAGGIPTQGNTDVVGASELAALNAALQASSSPSTAWTTGQSSGLGEAAANAMEAMSQQQQTPTASERLQQLLSARRQQLEQQILQYRPLQGEARSAGRTAGGATFDSLLPDAYASSHSLPSSDLAALLARFQPSASMGGAQLGAPFGMNLPHHAAIGTAATATNATALPQVPQPTTLAGNLPLQLPDASALLSAATRRATTSQDSKPRAKKPPPPPAVAASASAATLSAPLRLEKPKRPLSAYNLFFRDERARMLDELERNPPPSPPSEEEKESEADDDDDGGNESTRSPKKKKKKRKRRKKRTIAFAALAKTIGPKWKTIDPALLATYQAMAAQEKERYTMECAEYKVHQAREERMRASAAVASRNKEEEEHGHEFDKSHDDEEEDEEEGEDKEKKKPSK